MAPSAFTEQAAGGLFTTAGDLAIFMAAGMTGRDGEAAGRRVLTAPGVAALLAEHSLPDGSVTSLGYEVQTLPDGTHAAGHGGKNTGWRGEFLTLPDRREGIVVLTNSDRMDGILGLTEQAWGEWLGTGPPMTSQMQQSTLQPFYTLLLVIAGLLLLGALVGAAFLWRSPRRARRSWVWQDPQRLGPGAWLVRGFAVAAAAAAATVWVTLPLRADLASVTPVRVLLVTAALLLFCVAVAITALTRRAASEATGITPVRVRTAAQV